MMRSIDVHTHVLPPSYLAALAELGIETEKEDGFPEPVWNEEAHLAFIQQTDQAYQIVSISSPHPHRGDDGRALVWAQRINDEMAAVCHRHPDRMGFCAYLPLPNVEGSLEETARCFDELGALGVKVPSNANGVYLGSDRFSSLYEELDRRHAVVIIHPTAPSAMPNEVFTAKVKPIYEFFADTTRTVIDLLFTGTIARYPHIKWVVPHCGSFLPEVAHRLMGASQILVPRGMMPEVDVAGGLGQLYYDIAGVAQPVMLEALLKVARPTHLLYGSDYPYTPVPVIAQAKKSLEADPLLEGSVEDVFFGNATRLFGLDVSGEAS